MWEKRWPEREIFRTSGLLTATASLTLPPPIEMLARWALKQKEPRVVVGGGVKDAELSREETGPQSQENSRSYPVHSNRIWREGFVNLRLQIAFRGQGISE